MFNFKLLIYNINNKNNIYIKMKTEDKKNINRVTGKEITSTSGYNTAPETTIKMCKKSHFDWLNDPTGFSPESIKNNESYFLKCIKKLIPHRELITIVDSTKIRISFDTGLVIDNDVEVDYPTKTLDIKEVYIGCEEDFEQFKKSKYLYIHSIRKLSELEEQFVNDNIERAPKKDADIDYSQGFFLRLAEFTQGKRTVSFSIDDGTYEKFLVVCDKIAINKSKFIENHIKEFLNKIY